MKIPRKSSSSNGDSNSSSSSFLVQHATLILPYLTHTQLANISLTCKSLYKLTQIITLRRISDASRTFENYPIPFFNTNNNNNPPYSYFLYTPSLILSHNTPNYQPWGAGEGAFVISDDGSVRFGVGCDFEGVCENGSVSFGVGCEGACDDGGGKSVISLIPPVDEAGPVSFGVGCNFQGVCDDGSVGDGGGSSVISPIPPRTIHDVGLVRFGVGCENGKVGSGGMSSVISPMPPRTVDNDESVSFGVGCECEGICDDECMCFSDDGVDGIAGKYATGDEVFMADIFLAPQLDAASKRFNIDMNEFPTLSRLHETYNEIPAFRETLPENQPDAAGYLSQ